MSSVLKEKEQKTNSEAIQFVIDNFNWFLLGVFFVVFVFGIIIFIFPKYNEIAIEIKANEDRQSKEYSEKSKKDIEDLKLLISAYESISPSHIEKINKIIPPADIKEKIITEIEALVVRNGLILGAISIEPVEKDPRKKVEEKIDLPENITKYKITLKILGVNYNNLKNILRVFENNLRLLDVQSVDFSAEKNEAQIELHTYTFKN